LSAEHAIQEIGPVKLNKSIGMILLAVYLIFDGLLGFGLNVGPAIFLLYLVEPKQFSRALHRRSAETLQWKISRQAQLIISRPSANRRSIRPLTRGCASS